MPRYWPLPLLLGAGLAASAGCQPGPGPAAPPETPAVPVSRPVGREVMNFEEFTGQTQAVQMVDVKARVTGYLKQMPFTEGAEVREGDLLFEIDPRPYQAQLDQALAQIDSNEASYRQAKAVYAADLASPNAISQEQTAQDNAAMVEAEARIKAARASTEVYRLNLEFTRVLAPIDGQISRYYITRGNLVTQDSTALTTIVSLDPIHAYFEMDEPTLLRIRKAIREGRMTPPEDGRMPVYLGLQGEDGYPHQGVINFFNNQINSATGSISVRGSFPNPQPPGDLPRLAATMLGMVGSPAPAAPLAALAAPASGKLRGGVRLMSPGMFLRVRLPIGEPHRALLVIDRAIQSDQGLKYVYVVEPDNTVRYQRVTTGALQDDGLREIRDGLKPDDWVVVGGLQQVRPRGQVRPDPTDMPTLGSLGDGAKPAGESQDSGEKIKKKSGDRS